MVKRILATAAFLFFFMGGLAPALAHEIKQDGAIKVLLHIEPSDKPVVGSRTQLDFDIGQTGGGFDVNHCLCTVTIQQGETQLYNSALDVISPEEGVVSVVFPQETVYTVAISGKPDSLVSFAPFAISFDVPVATNVPFLIRYHHTEEVVLMGLAPILFIFWLIYDAFLQKRRVALTHSK